MFLPSYPIEITMFLPSHPIEITMFLPPHPVEITMFTALSNHQFADWVYDQTNITLRSQTEPCLTKLIITSPNFPVPNLI